jgi:predicted DNA-binding transcriptional regulator YafY
MATESFDKEIQFLRMLVLTSGAYSRKQFAERLGISVHTFDKTSKKLKDIALSVGAKPTHDGSADFALADAVRNQYREAADPVLLFLFRAKSLKESESHRISVQLAALQKGALTAGELLDVCLSAMPEDSALPDEKTVRSDLKYLEEVGVIVRDAGSRPYRYRMNHNLVKDLTDDELLGLYDFTDIMANTRLPSVQGYLLRDSLRKLLQSRAPGQLEVNPLSYKYHYYSRILDEAHLFTLLEAIRQHRKVLFVYFSPKAGKSYTSRNTNPLFERDEDRSPVTALPLRIIYDHQYGRWYLLGRTPRQALAKFRMDGITQLEFGEVVPEDFHAEKRRELDRQIEKSWLVDTGRPVTVRVRFFNPEEKQPNFVKERVLLQGQWGTIVEEDDSSFLFEIIVNGVTEIKPWLRSFGSSCEVLEPPYLRKEMIAEWKELRSYYESL